jgi:integrase
MGHMFAMAKRWNVPGAGSNPVQSQAGPSSKGSRELLLAPDDLSRLQEAAEASHNPQLKFIISLLLLTNLRMEELEYATWDDIDLDARIWRTASAKADKYHSVPLSMAAINVIQQLPRWDDCPHVIVNPRTRKPYRSFFKSWDAVRKKAGLPNISIHDLRHSNSAN